MSLAADAKVGEQCAGIGRTECPTEDLHPRPIRRCAGFLMAAAPQHQGPMLLGVVGQLLRDAGLADAGFAGDHHDLAAPAERLVERAAQGPKLGQPSDEHFGRRRHDVPVYGRQRGPKGTGEASSIDRRNSRR